MVFGYELGAFLILVGLLAVLFSSDAQRSAALMLAFRRRVKLSAPATERVVTSRHYPTYMRIVGLLMVATGATIVASLALR